MGSSIVSSDELELTNKIDQVLYIVGGDQHIPPVDKTMAEDNEPLAALIANLPPKPSNISEELFRTLYSLPIDPVIMEAVRLSMFNKENEWEELLNPDLLAMPEMLPWKEGESNDSRADYCSLNDLVVLRAVSPALLKTHVINSAIAYNETLLRPLLSDVLLVNRGCPLLVLFDDEWILSQANILIFEDTLEKTKSVSLLYTSNCLQSHACTGTSLDVTMLIHF